MLAITPSSDFDSLLEDEDEAAFSSATLADLGASAFYVMKARTCAHRKKSISGTHHDMDGARELHRDEGAGLTTAAMTASFSLGARPFVAVERAAENFGTSSA